MPIFNPFASLTGRHHYSLFDIRLNDDFIVFRGGEAESAGQLLKGVVVLCLSSPLRVEDIHLRLIGTLRFRWADGVSGTPGASGGHKIDRSTTILDHRWAPFVGCPGRSMVLQPGNYEYPFEYTLPGQTAESIEGIPEASITYRLKATVRRGKINPDLHTYKHLRIIRTLEPSALEFLHAMSVENIWPNKIEYSIVVPRKAVVFGGVVDLEMRFTPLLKALEVAAITAKMIEIRECRIIGSTGVTIRDRRTERQVASWRFDVTREEHWHDMIEDTGQEGWTVNKALALPKKLNQCIQDVDIHGVKVRHKIKLTIALQNPDGHLSELRATLPVSIFISPNIPFDENGSLVRQTPNGASSSSQEAGLFAPPGYGEHVLDQLYDELDVGGYQTPAVHSGVTSPFYGLSRSGSSDNLTAIAHSAPIAPAALVSRLADVSLDQFRRSHSDHSLHDTSPRGSPTALPNGGGAGGAGAGASSYAATLSRTNSEEDGSRRLSAGEGLHAEADLEVLSRVPSYATAVRTPARSRTTTSVGFVPDYQTALSAPKTPPTPAADGIVEPLSPIMGPLSGPSGMVRSQTFLPESTNLEYARSRARMRTWAGDRA